MPSSGSDTVIVYGTVSPKLNSVPLTGVFSVTVGAVLPTVITTLAVPVRPAGSVTVSVTVRWPLLV